jgi:hypothetical protein
MIEERSGVAVLYDSTKSLLQSILRSLETGDETQWDDRTESGNARLYEMHQMSEPLYTAYRTDRLIANSVAQSSLSEKLNRAMPYVRTMVIAIRHKDQTTALESGKAALAEMNETSPLIRPGCYAEPQIESQKTSNAVRQQADLTGKHRRVEEDQSASRRIRVSRRKRD